MMLIKVESRRLTTVTQTPQPPSNQPRRAAFFPDDANDFRKEESMSRLTAIFVALGSLAIVATPLAASHAQSPASMVDAAQTCRDYGVRPGTAAYDTCLNRAAWAYDRGQPGLASAEAARVSDAGNLCLSYGIGPQTLGYRECVAAEINRRPLPSDQVRYVPSPDRSGPDRYGFYYDANGNVRDRNGELVRFVPLSYR
jgi:hypothetical protein